MLGDVLLIADKHRVAAQAIFEFVKKNYHPKMLVGISGESGSGKTELAHVLAKLLKTEKICAKPLHIDNYYRIPPLERTEWRQNNGIENAVGYGEYDWDKIYENIADFKADKVATMPCIDLVTEQVDSLTTNFKGVDMLIIDGLYANKTEGIDVRVFIELTYRETKKAQLDRGKEPDNPYRWAVLEQEHKMVQALKPLSDLFVNMEYLVVPAK